MKNIIWSHDRLSGYKAHYSTGKLWDKIRRFGKKAGAKVVYCVLQLYYALKDQRLSLRDKAVILGALGYFILPFDIVPDIFFGGYVEDYAALLFALNHLRSKIDESTRRKARERLRELFPDEEVSEDGAIEEDVTAEEVTADECPPPFREIDLDSPALIPGRTP